MKKKELAGITTLQEHDAIISAKFAEWDSIRANGSPGVNFMPDGYILNNLRRDIIQLRERRDKRFEPEIVGQTDLFGGEEKEERPAPDIMPMGWTSEATEKRKKTELMAQFASMCSF